MTPLDVVWVAVLAFVAGAAAGYRLARAVMVRFVAEIMTQARAQKPDTAYESPAVAVLRAPPGPTITPTRSPFGARRHKLPLA